MDEKYKNKYRTTPVRLTGWDYGSHGLYFITICTKDRVRYFGEITLEAHDYVPVSQKESQDIRSPNETHNHVSLQETEIGRLPMITGYKSLYTFLLLNWMNL